MSSARNHAKRSHRSQHDIRSNTMASSHKMMVKPSPTQQRTGLLARLAAKLFKRNKTT
jgi:hypothetical protein